jgi:hypothetical protein
MARSIDGTEIGRAFTQLGESIAATERAFSQLEAYYRHGAAVDLDAASQMGLEVLEGLLQRVEALAKSVRQDTVLAVERLWTASAAERQALHERQRDRLASSERFERERARDERAGAAGEARSLELDQQQQVNRLIRSDGE